MNDNLKGLLLEGIKAKRRSIENRTKNLLSVQFGMLVDEEHGMDLDQFIDQLERELNNLKRELIQLNNVEKEANE